LNYVEAAAELSVEIDSPFDLVYAEQVRGFFFFLYGLPAGQASYLARRVRPH
jgi:hypothetical protein